MTLSSRTLTPDWGQAAEIIERGQPKTLGVGLRLAGETVTPDSGTVAIYRDAGETDVYLAPTAITPGTTSTYDLAAPSSSEPLSDMWISVWSWVVSGVTYRDRRSTYLVGYSPSMRVDDEDLYAVVSHLRSPARIPPGQTNWSPQILLAWDTILSRLTKRGKRPWLTIDTGDLFAWHLALSAAEACAAIPADNGAYFATRAMELRAEASRLELALAITYEDTPTVSTLVGPSLYTCAPRGRGCRSW